MAGVLVIGTVLGYQAGHTIGNLVTGQDAPGLLFEGPVRAVTLVAFSLVPGVLATYFFYTRSRLATIQAQAQEAQRHAAQAQLRLLESQLEPHMLFNTLANLRVLIALDPPRAQAMLDQLIAFLRATLNASRAGQHALSAEFSRIADYLALMKVRMGERLQTDLVLPDELASLPVPPLLLQPLVENSIRHGLEPKVEGGRVVLEASREGDVLVLRVRDTGVGLADPSTDGTHFGLQQVRERLATLYGDRASLHLAAAGDGRDGTVATIRLPITP
jgi:LytS/YehU family sensor histidine kinase